MFRTRNALIVAILASLPLASIVAAERPNVIVIYTDDQGSIDMNCYGSRDLITPTMDELARTGVRFTQMYSPSAICSASRAGLLTGRFPFVAGVPGNVSSEKGKAGMPTEQITMAEMFHDAGYKTGHVGKWHLGFTPETMPNGQGFDSSVGHMGGCIDNYSHFFYWVGPNRHDLWRNGKEIFADGKYFGDMMVEECKEFLSQHQSDPFFLYWAINWPHYPLQGTDKWRQRYTKVPHPRDKYGAFVSTLDERIGMVLQHLEKLGLRKKTIIVLQSDHGHSTETRTFGGGGSAGPYRGAKGCLFEGGIRVPSIVSMPGTLPEGEVRDQMVTGCDWFPTLAKLCDVSLPTDHVIQGKDISAIIASPDGKSPHESFYWALGGQWVVRKGDWKLLGNPRDNSKRLPLTNKDKLFLVDLTQDVGETRNVASDHPEIVKELKSLRDSYAATKAD